MLGAVALVGLVWWVALPFLRWRTTTYTMSRKRMTIRSGVLGFKEVNLGLSKVVAVSVKVKPSDQFFGTGTLVVEFPGRHGEVELPDIPQVDYWNVQLNQLLWPESAPKPELAPVRRQDFTYRHNQGKAAA